MPEGLLFTKEHEWVRVEDGHAVIGITDHAQNQLGDIVFLELPSEGDELSAGDAFGVVESVKAVSDLYAPVTGVVVEVNQPLVDAPEGVNDDAFGEGWMVKVRIEDESALDELMDAKEYDSYVAEEG
jgi:glycine cleavage system H protein